MRMLTGLFVSAIVLLAASSCGSDSSPSSGGGGTGGAGATGGSSGGTGGMAGSTSGGTAGTSGGAGGSAGTATGGGAGANPTADLEQALQVTFKVLSPPMDPSSACTGTAPDFTDCSCDGGGSYDMSLGPPITLTAKACTESASSLSYTGTQTMALPSGSGSVTTFTVNMSTYGKCQNATGSYTVDQSTHACAGNLSAMCPGGSGMVATMCTVSGVVDTQCTCN